MPDDTINIQSKKVLNNNSIFHKNYILIDKRQEEPIRALCQWRDSTAKYQAFSYFPVSASYPFKQTLFAHVCNISISSQV